MQLGLVCLAVVHGYFGDSGLCQRFYRSLQMPVTFTVEAHFRCARLDWHDGECGGEDVCREDIIACQQRVFGAVFAGQ